MKVILLAYFLIGAVECHTETTIVYICDSPGAKKYHYKEDCRGLKACQHPVVKTTLEKAEQDKKTLCGWEQKQ